MKYLELYNKCANRGKLPKQVGLCYLVGYDNEQLRVFKPTEKEIQEYKCSHFYWLGPMGVFTEERQTVILLLAAMNGEL